MICDICNKQQWYAGFTEEVHGDVVHGVEHLIGICFDCYGTVPNHIPLIQVRKFLERRYETGKRGLWVRY